MRKRQRGLALKAFSAWALVAAEHVESQNEAFVKLAGVQRTQEVGHPSLLHVSEGRGDVPARVGT